MNLVSVTVIVPSGLYVVVTDDTTVAVPSLLLVFVVVTDSDGDDRDASGGEAWGTTTLACFCGGTSGSDSLGATMKQVIAAAKKHKREITSRINHHRTYE
jgi:pyruvoyl-dependent arginine decarboxylase (PvlArgDC)